MEKREIEKNIKILEKIYLEERDNTPQSTIDRFIEVVGKDVAIMTVASCVTLVGDWDERICSQNRIWAQSLSPYARGEFECAGIYGTSIIHSAHIDQIASVTRKI